MPGPRPFPMFDSFGAATFAAASNVEIPRGIMQFVFNKSAAGRRAATGTVLALAAATLSLGFGGPADALAGHDIEGTVTGVGGAPVNDACVDAYDASDGVFLDEACTGVDGTYFFDALGVSQVKLNFYDDSN